MPLTLQGLRRQRLRWTGDAAPLLLATMSWMQSLNPSKLSRFLRTRTLGRSVVLLLGSAILLLLAINVSTYVLIQRTAGFNAEAERTWQIRRATRTLLLNLKDAEAAQRGFLLIGEPEFLRAFEAARAAHPGLLDALAERVGDDPVGVASVEALHRLSRDKFDEMSSTVAMVERGDMDGAMAIVAAGHGKTLMRDFEAEVADVDIRIGNRLAAQREKSEGSARFTVAVNAAAGLLILILAAIVAIMIRRYLAEIQQARADLDRVNAGLEESVRARTAALVRANEEVQRYAYIVSHDLRSPLVNVMGYTAELEQAGKTMDAAIRVAEKERPVDPEVVRAVREDMPEAIGFIRASTARMDRLINAILKLSRDGRRTLLPETLDVAEMAERAADAVRHQIQENDGELVVEPMPSFESDRLSIEQILGNLIDNAVKYSDPKRPLRITVSGRDVADGWVEYAVADNGRGVAEKDHERIFELFRRAGRQDRPGEGLGLAFVRNSVRRLGGDIMVESTLGEGSTFRLKFPKRLVLDDAGETV